MFSSTLCRNFRSCWVNPIQRVLVETFLWRIIKLFLQISSYGSSVIVVLIATGCEIMHNKAVKKVYTFLLSNSPRVQHRVRKNKLNVHSCNWKGCSPIISIWDKLAAFEPWNTSLKFSGSSKPLLLPVLHFHMHREYFLSYFHYFVPLEACAWFVTYFSIKT